MTATPAPRAEYLSRLDQRRRELSRHDLLYRRTAYARLSVAGLLAVIVWLVFGPGLLTPWWLLVPPVAFLGLMALHSRIDKRRLQISGAVAFYERGLARLEDRWVGTGETGDRFADEAHLYAADLDLFGRGSLFELLSTARTQSGEGTLADWLRTPATASRVRARQAAVAELEPLLDLREDLATVGPDLRSAIHIDRLAAWAKGPPEFGHVGTRHAATVLSLAAIVALVYTAVSGNPWPYYVSLVPLAALLLVFRERTERVLASVELPMKELVLSSEVIRRIEEEEFACTRLRELRAAFGHRSARASEDIGRLVRLVERHLSLKNANGPLTIVILFLTATLLETALVVPPTLILLLALRTAIDIEDWRRRHGDSLEAWIRSVGEFEALMALSGYAHEHPGDPYPEVVDRGPIVDGRELGHPLLPTSHCVTNSITLDSRHQLVVVSGSNMSGKSTLLRTIGINVVLALAGAPVRSETLRISPMAIGATLRIQDSLQAGTSRFYAEITRIRDIMQLTRGGLPVLFLLDEVLHGTNSRDRAIGAEGIVRGLLERGAVGVATTHDLALTRVADALGGRAINVHFEDRMEDGKMAFDYKMKPGVIEKSNALELMRSIGLDV